MNLFTSENLQKYKLSNSSGHGEWMLHKGENAIGLAPTRFYSNSTYVKVLENEFMPNTQYVFNLYIDTDHVLSSDKNVVGGIQVRYTDGSDTNTILTKKGDQTNSKGWQNIFFISDPDKSVSHFIVYYYTSARVPYRWDSYIGPLQTAQVEQPGLFNTGTLNSNYNINNTASIQKGGIIYSNNFYEF